MLLIISWYNSDDRRGIALDLNGRVVNFKASNLTPLLLEHGLWPRLYVDVDFTYPIEVDLPERRQVYCGDTDILTEEAETLLEIYKTNEVERKRIRAEKTANKF